ncbi:sister chromatid cohesion protein 1, variant 2 [Dionaea muscipula]
MRERLSWYWWVYCFIVTSLFSAGSSSNGGCLVSAISLPFVPGNKNHVAISLSTFADCSSARVPYCNINFPSFLLKQRLSTSGVQLRGDFGVNFGPLKFNRARNYYQLRSVLTACIISGGYGGNAPSDSNDVESINVDDGQRVIEDQGIPFHMKKPITKLREIATTLRPPVFTLKRQSAANLVMAFCIATTCLIVAVRVYVVRRRKDNQPGTVTDLVRRGQLRGDRRGISKPLMYEDPFNNPLVKVGKGNSTVEMCGKVYRLAAITLTEEQQALHQKRRSRAYQWRRPKVFLKEGDSIPPDVDPDTIRWIPVNHPFATTSSDIDEDLAQNNVYQKHGVPFRIQAEHEALQKKLEALQNEQKFNKLMIDPVNARDFERAFKGELKPHEMVDHAAQNGEVSESTLRKQDKGPDTSDGNLASA